MRKKISYSSTCTELLTSLLQLLLLESHSQPLDFAMIMMMMTMTSQSPCPMLLAAPSAFQLTLQQTVKYHSMSTYNDLKTFVIIADSIHGHFQKHTHYFTQLFSNNYLHELRPLPLRSLRRLRTQIRYCSQRNVCMHQCTPFHLALQLASSQYMLLLNATTLHTHTSHTFVFPRALLNEYAYKGCLQLYITFNSHNISDAIINYLKFPRKNTNILLTQYMPHY